MKGNLLFIDSENKKHFESDYINYFLKNNTFTKSHIKAIKEGNKKVLHNINLKIWLQELKKVTINYEVQNE